MVKPVNGGYIVKLPKITQIYHGDKMVNITEGIDRIEKTYVNTKTMEIIKKVVSFFTGVKSK